MPTLDFDYSQVRGIPEVMLRTALLEERLQAQPGSKDAAALEIGLGGGDVTLMLARRFAQLTCVDLCAQTCRQVRERCQENGLNHVRFHESAIEEMELPAGYFDHIILLGILEHLPDPVAVLRKLRACLKPGGRMHITVNLANSLHRWLGVALGMIPDVEALSEQDCALGHYRVYTAGGLAQDVQAAGLKSAYERPFYLKPLPTSLMNKLPEHFHSAFDQLGRKFPELASYIYVEASK